MSRYLEKEGLLDLDSRLLNFDNIIIEEIVFEEMTEILEAPHEIKDVKNAKTLKVNGGNIEFKEVDFTQVYHHYFCFASYGINIFLYDF